MAEAAMNRTARLFPRKGRPLRVEMLFSVSVILFLLVMFAAYMLFSGRQIAAAAERSLAEGRFIRSVRMELDEIRRMLLDCLQDTRPAVPEALRSAAGILREKLSALASVRTAPDEAALYSLAVSWLDLADRALAEKEASGAVFAETAEELDALFTRIGGGLDRACIERFYSRTDYFERLVSRSGALQLLNLFFVTGASVLVILSLSGFARRLTVPLKRLSGMADSLLAERFGLEDTGDTEAGRAGYAGEINQVMEAFSRMKREIRRLFAEKRQEEELRQEYLREKMRNMKMESLIRHMEIYTLQAQMSPHFLFNSLNTGMQLAIVEGADRTCEFLECMAKFFRHTIRKREIIVPLRHEIEGLGYYFDILRVRFYRNIDLVLDYDESLLDTVAVPVSIIQPLVENCVIHAFKARSALLAGLPGGMEIMRPRIQVRVEQREKRLFISVQDNGCGMSGETRDKLLRPLPSGEVSLSRATGLASIIQRLYFFYPEDPEIISIESETENGTSIVISIDMEREPCTVSSW